MKLNFKNLKKIVKKTVNGKTYEYWENEHYEYRVDQEKKRFTRIQKIPNSHNQAVHLDDWEDYD